MAQLDDLYGPGAIEQLLRKDGNWLSMLSSCHIRAAIIMLESF